MSESSICAARQALLEAWAALDLASGSVSGQDAIDQLLFLRSMNRRVDHGSLRLVAQLDSDGEFTERGVRPAAGGGGSAALYSGGVASVGGGGGECVPDLAGRCGVAAPAAGHRDRVGWLGNRPGARGGDRA